MNEPAHGISACKDEVLTRLGKIEGQVRGIRRMAEEEKYCVDILMQVASVHEALRGLGKVLMRDHLRHCVTAAIRSEDEARTEQTYQELLDLVYKYAR